MDTYQTTKWGEVSEDFLFDKMGKWKRARVFLYIAQLFLVLAVAAGVITALSVTETISWDYQDETILAAVICAGIFVLFFVIWLILFISGDLTGVKQALAEAGEQLDEHEQAEKQEKQERKDNERLVRDEYDDDDDDSDDYDDDEDDEDDEPEPPKKVNQSKKAAIKEDSDDEQTMKKRRVVYPTEEPSPVKAPAPAPVYENSDDDDDDDWDLDEDFTGFDEDEQEEPTDEEDVDADDEEDVEIPVPVFDEEGDRQEKMIAESVRNIISAQTDNPDFHVEDPEIAENGEEDEMNKEDLGLTRSLLSLSEDIDDADDEPMDILLQQMNNIVRGHFKKQEKEINDLKERCDALLKRLDEEQNLRKEAEQTLADTLEEMSHMQRVEENTNIEFLPDAALIELNMDIVIPVVPVPEDTGAGGPAVAGADGDEAPSNVTSVFD